MKKNYFSTCYKWSKPIVLIILGVILFAGSVYAQKSGTVIYKQTMNGKDLPDEPKIMLQYKNGIAKITNIVDEANKKSDEASYIDFAAGKTYQTVIFKEGRRYTSIDSLISYPKPMLTEETIAMVSGYMCRLATVTIRSNHIELWYTEDAGMKGSPALNLGPELGLVLKVIRNGNYEITAESINTVDAVQNELPADLGEIVDLPTYRQKVTENNYITYRIFDREKINFGDTIVNPASDEENITYRYSNGTVLLKKIKLPENLNNHFVFAEISEESNGDAYDRTGSFFIIPTGTKTTFLDALKNGIGVLPVYEGSSKKYQGIVSTENYSPPLELVRFFTPFGIGKYNSQVTVNGIKWEDSVTYKMDITDLLPALGGEVWVGIFIGCYDKGGHIVSASLKYHPFDLNQPVTTPPKIWIQPIVNTVNIMEMSGQEYGTVFLDDTLRVTSDIPEGLMNLKLRYISTGHGGWDAGDEFNPKTNEIFIDNVRVYSYIPWRSDCASFRKYNPATGNFPIGVSSSDFSRSGWCPGTATNPVDIPLDVSVLKPGKHIIKVFIPMGKPEGTSFSAWNVSAVMIGEFK